MKCVLIITIIVIIYIWNINESTLTKCEQQIAYLVWCVCVCRKWKKNGSTAVCLFGMPKMLDFSVWYVCVRVKIHEIINLVWNEQTNSNGTYYYNILPRVRVLRVDHIDRLSNNMWSRHIIYKNYFTHFCFVLFLVLFSFALFEVINSLF